MLEGFLFGLHSEGIPKSSFGVFGDRQFYFPSYFVFFFVKNRGAKRQYEIFVFGQKRWGLEAL